MKFFSNFFSRFKHRSYIKFSTNLFFLKNMLSHNIKHTEYMHIFTPTKTLKLKIFKSFKFSYTNHIFVIIVFLFLISLVYLLINFSRLVVKITGFHPVDSGSIPG